MLCISLCYTLQKLLPGEISINIVIKLSNIKNNRIKLT